MSPTESDPTPFEQELLRELRIARPAESGARERVATRLGFAALAPEVTGDGGAVEHGAAQAASKVAAFTGTRALSVAAITFVLGATAGVTGRAWLDPPAVKIVYLERRAERPASLNPAPSIEPEPFASSVPSAPAPAMAFKGSVRVSSAIAVSSATPASSSASELGPEVTMLDQARKAMSERHYARAFELLASHARLFPASVLEQEREALEIKALVATGRHAEARARAQRFRSRFPKSMLLDSIEKAVATIP